jgi:hypothetical protein
LGREGRKSGKSGERERGKDEDQRMRGRLKEKRTRDDMK